MINWKDLISKDDKYIDLESLPRYTIKWDAKSKVEHIYERDIIIPTEPPDDACVNWGLPEYDQIYRRTLIPKQVLNPTKNFGRENWTQKRIDDFIDAEWHRRRNGVWFWIKGKKTYIPPLLNFKMNYWRSITGVEFIYKSSDRDICLFWQAAIYDPNCDGVADFKCRQLGDTETVLAMIYEYGSRVRGTINAIQSCINEGHAKKSYFRLVHGHKKMLYYFRPLNQGTEDPKKGLNLSYPAQHITFSSLKKKNEEGELANKSSLDDYEYPEVGSQFYFGPSNESEFDGTTLGRAYLDEFGKSKGQLNPVEWIKVIKEATESRILNRKMGMIIMTSTVEDIGSDSLTWAKTIWSQSDPKKLTSEGKTANGLWRCFRNAVDRGEVDRWGFPLKDKIIAGIKEKYKMFIDSGDIKGAISFMRKNCLTIEDVFIGANDESQFDIEKLTKRLFWLQNEASKKMCVRGNLKWKDGIPDTQVIWEPNSNGKWMISKHPEDFGLQSNAKITSIIAKKPGNAQYFKAGLDPYDQQTTMEAEPSLGGIAVKRVLDEYIDGGLDRYHQYDDPDGKFKIGDPVNWGADFITNRIVCDYLYRENDPNDFFEDLILTLVYYGTDFLPEKDKFGACHSYLKTRGYDLYLMEKPTDRKNAKGQIEREGVSATIGNIDTYFSFLTTLTAKWANTIDHPRVLEQLLTTNFKNRGKKDLSVAVGWCEFAANQPKSAFKRQIQEELTHYQEYAV